MPVQERNQLLRESVRGLGDMLRRVVAALAAPARVGSELADLRERVEYLEDSLAAVESRAERDEAALRPWSEVRR